MPKSVVVGEGEEFLKREGLKPSPEVWEDGLRISPGRGNFEWWYFDAHLDDGSTLVVIYSTKRGVDRTGPLKPTLQLTLTTPDGRHLSCLESYAANQFRASKERCDVQIGRNRVSGDLHRYEMHFDCQGITGDLVLTGSVPSWRPGTGKFFYNEGLTSYFAWLPSVPYGRIEGTLTYEGREHAVTGSGYHDHNWGNVGLESVMSRWYWGRAHVGEYSAIFVQTVGSKAYGSRKIPVFWLAKGDRLITDNRHALTLETGDEQTHPSGKRYPARLDYHWQTEEGTIHLALRQPQLIEAASLLETLPVWKRALARLVANPYLFRFNADLELSINLKDLKAQERGQALYDMMMLR
jgi:predicted secreted hydrolase